MFGIREKQKSRPDTLTFPQSQPLKIAKLHSRQLKIHPKSPSTATPEQYSHFFGQKTRYTPLFSERRMPQKWLKHGLFQPSFNLFLLAEPPSSHASSSLSCTFSEASLAVSCDNFPGFGPPMCRRECLKSLPSLSSVKPVL